MIRRKTLIVLRWAFGHRDSADSCIEVPAADVGRLLACLEGLVHEQLDLDGGSVVSEEALAAAVRHAGPVWVAEQFGGLADQDGDQWWRFLATASFHGGLVVENTTGDHDRPGAETR